MQASQTECEALRQALDRLLDCELKLQQAYDLEKPIDSFLLEAFSKAVDGASHEERLDDQEKAPKKRPCIRSDL